MPTFLSTIALYSAIDGRMQSLPTHMTILLHTIAFGRIPLRN